MPISYWLFVFLTFALSVFMSYGTYSTARLLRTWTPDRNLLLLPAENLVRLVLIALCIALGLLSGVGAEPLGWTVARPASHLLHGIGWGCGLALFFYFTTRRLMMRTGGRFYSTVVLESILPHSRGEAVGVVLLMGPVVLLEELLFRSLLLGGLSPIVPGVSLLVGTGILFGLMHSPQGSWGMVGAGAAGVLFGLLFWSYGTLLTPIVAHYVANVAQIGYALYLRQRGAFPQSGQSRHTVASGGIDGIDIGGHS